MAKDHYTEGIQAIDDVLAVAFGSDMGPLLISTDCEEYPDHLKETSALDNSFVSADYGNQRITHSNKGAFKSVTHPIVESSISPPALSMADNRDFVMSFSDYVAST